MMKLLLIPILLIPFLCFSQFNAEVIFPELEGQELLDNVVNDFKPSVVLTYGPARDSMFANIYNVNDSLYCVYSGHRLYMDPALDPTTAVFLNGIDNGINTEHTYPRSKGAENGNARSDMNHLFATRVRVNSERGNLPFGDIDDQNTTQWFINTTSQSQIPTNNIDDYSEWNGQFFEPKESHKGNVARAMFYFYTMYKAEADAADPNYFTPQIETFCRWHEDDPVDSLEWVRAFQIAQYQDGKVNPFVLDCSLAGRSYCEAVSTACRSVSNTELVSQNDLKIFPNPISDHVTFALEFEGNKIISFQLTDILGRAVYKEASKSYNTYFEKKLRRKDLNLKTSQLLIAQFVIENNKGNFQRISKLLVLAGE